MPIVTVNIREGRTLDQKREMVERMTEVLCDTMRVQPTSVQIIINEMKDDAFAKAGKLVCDAKAEAAKAAAGKA